MMLSSYRLIVCIIVLATCAIYTLSSFTDTAICSLIAATNVQSISTTSMWQCTTAGIMSTNPCSPQWNGIACSSTFVVVVNLNTLGLTGIYKLHMLWRSMKPYDGFIRNYTLGDWIIIYFDEFADFSKQDIW